MRRLLQRLFAWCDAQEDSELSGVLLERRKAARRQTDRQRLETNERLARLGFPAASLVPLNTSKEKSMTLKDIEALPWQGVESSNLSRVAFVARTVSEGEAEEVAPEDAPGSLYVEFTSGEIYSYAEVPAGVHGELVDADSVGSFLNREIKGTYAATRVHVEEEA